MKSKYEGLSIEEIQRREGKDIFEETTEAKDENEMQYIASRHTRKISEHDQKILDELKNLGLEV